MSPIPPREDVPDGAELYTMRLEGETLSSLAARYSCSVSLITSRIDKFADKGTSMYEGPAVAYEGPRAPGWAWDPPDWTEHALCAQVDPEPFFAEKGGSTREAKKVCLSCDVRNQCLEYALDHDERHGIWGGLSERERRRIKRPQHRRYTRPPGPGEVA